MNSGGNRLDIDRPASAKVASSPGIAALSFDFAAVARSPSTGPAYSKKRQKTTPLNELSTARS